MTPERRSQLLETAAWLVPLVFFIVLLRSCVKFVAETWDTPSSLTRVEMTAESPTLELEAQLSRTTYGVFGGHCEVTLVHRESGNAAEILVGHYSLVADVQWLDPTTLEVRVLLREPYYAKEGKDLHKGQCLVGGKRVVVVLRKDGPGAIGHYRPPPK